MNAMDSAERDLLGIIGAGRLGQAMARTALRAGRRVVIANSRGPESLAPVVSALGDGVSAGTVEQAAAAPTVALAVPWEQVPGAVRGLQWSGQIVIDATNDFAATDFEGGDLDGRTSSELVAGLVSGARVVKGANTLVAAVLGADPHEAAGQRVIFLSGDDADAKTEARTLFEDAGFFVMDLGDLVTGGRMQQIRAPLAGVNLIRLPDAD
ncbi:MAG: 8-hydroxy-5-deazaflavin:NADPH oxidoreductase [Solirubrobacteraceae bacterium]|nr:8-hydroxy-5-deazaflavin:NADPH oxidoreductase [Solirubrobacteraceae bacterium]